RRSTSPSPARSAASCWPDTRSSSRASTTTPTSRPGSSSRTTSTCGSASWSCARTPRSTSPTSSGSWAGGRASSPSRSPRTPSGPSPTRRGSRSWPTRSARSPGRTPCTTRRTGRSTSLRSWRAYKVRPAPGYETGTLPHELLAGFVAAVGHLDELGWEAIQAHERALGERFLAGLPERCTLHGIATMEGRTPTFAFTVAGHTPRAVAEHLAERQIAVWDGDYYAVEVMRRLGLQPEGAVRAGFVHYNTADEVDRLLSALKEL